MTRSFLLSRIFLGLSITTSGAFAQHYYDTAVSNPLVAQNTYINQPPVYNGVPDFKAIKALLPQPLWSGREDVIRCYWKAWELAFSNVRNATPQNGFISPYISPAFNNHIFMWDTSFMMLFGRYGHHAFNFQGSLDNFYKTQHKDGYISREISESDGTEIFEKFDPSSTGPNLLPWAEWDYYTLYKDKERLSTVFPVLLAYYNWLQMNRTWQDGSYFASGWSCGMDNQPRVPNGYHLEFSHGFMSWIDTTLQQLFAAKILVRMAGILGRKNDTAELNVEITSLTKYVQLKMWDPKTLFFYDRYRDGSLSKLKSIAAYWALLANVVPPAGRDRFIAHLDNPKEFARLHRVPTLSADDSAYRSDGNYWRGGVWSPTTYMVLRGLSSCKKDSLAHEIALNHLNNVVRVFGETGTLWENYAPDLVRGMYRKDMVGWTGLTPISVLLEYVFGLSADKDPLMLVWDVRLLDEFSVKNYPLKLKGFAELHCGRRRTKTEKPVITVRSNTAFVLKVIWAGGTEIIHVKPSSI